MGFLLDTSALVAWLNEEPGFERVRHILISEEEPFVPWPVLFEILYLAIRTSGEPKALERYAAIRQLPLRFLLEMDEQLILTAARLKALYPISQSDALIAAYAITADAVLVHKDPEYSALQNEVRQEPLPFKK